MPKQVEAIRDDVISNTEFLVFFYSAIIFGFFFIQNQSYSFCTLSLSEESDCTELYICVVATCTLQEQYKSSDMEQQPPFGDRK